MQDFSAAMIEISFCFVCLLSFIHFLNDRWKDASSNEILDADCFSDARWNERVMDDLPCGSTSAAVIWMSWLLFATFSFTFIRYDNEHHTIESIRCLINLLLTSLTEVSKSSNGSVNLVISVATVVGIGDSQVVSNPSDDGIAFLDFLLGPRRALITARRGRRRRAGQNRED
jgi:hypothetical protein